MKCLICQKKLMTKYQKKFCCKSCAATYNNKFFIKKKRKIFICKQCGSEANYRNVYCEKCKQEGKHHKYGKRVEDYTIQDIETRSSITANRYRAIRQNAKSVMDNFNQEKKCNICGYSKHVEVCHIKPISSFPKDTKIKVINDLSNLKYLCPNHHWEHDKN